MRAQGIVSRRGTANKSSRESRHVAPHATGERWLLPESANPAVKAKLPKTPFFGHFDGGSQLSSYFRFAD